MFFLRIIELFLLLKNTKMSLFAWPFIKLASIAH